LIVSASGGSGINGGIIPSTQSYFTMADGNVSTAGLIPPGMPGNIGYGGGGSIVAPQAKNLPDGGFSSTAAAGAASGNSSEVRGERFYVTSTTTINQIFLNLYGGYNESGTITGYVWNNSGSLLASSNAYSISAGYNGWSQNMILNTNLTLSPNEIYWISFFFTYPSGGVEGFFAFSNSSGNTSFTDGSSAITVAQDSGISSCNVGAGGYWPGNTTFCVLNATSNYTMGFGVAFSTPNSPAGENGAVNMQY
jgi:hypothetical protein